MQRLLYKCVRFISWISTHAGQNSELFLKVPIGTYPISSFFDSIKICSTVDAINKGLPHLVISSPYRCHVAFMLIKLSLPTGEEHSGCYS